MMLAHYARMHLAIALIAHRARISIVHQETAIPRDTLRALYREYHGISAPSGQLPAFGGAAITTRRMQLQASLFAVTYRRCCEERGGDGPAPPAPRIEAIITAHDYSEAPPPSPLDTDETFARRLLLPPQHPFEQWPGRLAPMRTARHRLPRPSTPPDRPPAGE
jgi:hypothetical protein